MAEQQPVQVIITGFGSFHGVPSNPTERIVGWLQRQFAVGEGGDSPPAQSLRHGHIHSCTILKVSARAVNDYLIKQLEDLKQRSLEACNGATAAAQTGGGGRDACAAPVVLLLHFGVDVHRPWFNLETRAVNNATFRAPDEDGWQPDRHPITTAPGTSLGCAVCTDLDLARLQRRLRGSGHDVRLSTDAGKFVCNWTYYNSLALCREAMAAGAAAVTAAAATAAAAPTAADTAMPDVVEPSGGGGGTSASGSGSDGSSSSSCSSSGGGGGSSDAVSDAHGGAAGSSSPLRASVPSAPLAAAAPAAPPSGCGGGGGRFGALAVHSLFVHVPSFSAISEDRQLRFAVNLIEALCEQLYHHHLAKSSGGAAGGGNGQAQRQRQHQHRQRSHGRGHNGPQSRGHSSGSRHGGGAGGGAGGGSHSSHQTSQQYQQEHPQHHHQHQQHQQQQQHQQPLQQQQQQQPWAAEPHWHHQHEFGGLAVSGIHHQHVSA